MTGLPADIKAVAGGGTHSLALGSDGRVYGWGYNTYGQVGGSTVTFVWVTPRQATGLPADITAIAAGGYHSLAVTREAPAPTATTVTATPGQQEHGQPVTLTAHVTCEAGTPAGTVGFRADGITIGTAELAGAGTAGLTVSDLAVGTHQVTAAYNGAPDCAASESGPVTVTITPARPPVPPRPPSLPRPPVPAPPQVPVTG